MSEKESIEQRNRRVEMDKAWEVSKSRRAAIAFGTYIVVGGYLSFLRVENSWLHAVVPTGAYIISTLGLGFAKSIWVKRIYKDDKNQ